MNATAQMDKATADTMKLQSTLSPVSLRYVAALRGNKPKKTGTEFTYAEMGCHNIEHLICLAASNPEGRFYGFVGDEQTRRSAEREATERGTFNIIFMTGLPSQILASLANGSSLPPMLDYLCCNEFPHALPASEREALFSLADKRLNPGGLFTTVYRAYQEDDGALRFLVREMAPEMNEAQQLEFLGEIEKISARYLATNQPLAMRLEDSIQNKTPQKFFSAVNGDMAKHAPSGTFDTMAAMKARGFAYGGDAAMSMNYVDIVIPQEAQELVISTRNSPFYEIIKDMATSRLVRADIWVKQPAELSADATELFGGFAYGITMQKKDIPSAFSTQSKVVDLSAPLYTNLLDLMEIMPIGVADALSQDSLKSEKPTAILEALQVLVVCGFAFPMRGSMIAMNSKSIAQPRLVGSFNRFIDKTELSDKDIYLASQVAGCGIALSPRKAFVIQALNRAGLENSVSALMPELRRIAHTPTALMILETEEPTAEDAYKMIKDIVGDHLPQWYAYALLEAA